MIDKLNKLFSEDPTISLMRVLVAFIIIDALILATSMIFVDKDFTNIVLGMIGIALTGKLWQKKYENS